MKELQRQRKREKGVTLELKGTDGAPVEKLDPDDEARDMNLDNTFTAQTDAGEVDPNMLKYIEEQMEKGEDGAPKRANAFDADDEELFATPAHLKRMKSDINLTEAEDAGRWLAGIVEVQVAPEDKMAAIEATENAKRKLMEARAKRGAPMPSAMDIPSNFNSNFHKHRREGAQMIKSKGSGGGGPGHTNQPSDPNLASDGRAAAVFRANDRNNR